MAKPRDKSLNVRFSDEEYKKLKILSEEDNRSMSGYIRNIINEFWTSKKTPLERYECDLK